MMKYPPSVSRTDKVPEMIAVENPSMTIKANIVQKPVRIMNRSEARNWRLWPDIPRMRIRTAGMMKTSRAALITVIFGDCIGKVTWTGITRPTASAAATILTIISFRLAGRAAGSVRGGIRPAPAASGSDIRYDRDNVTYSSRRGCRPNLVAFVPECRYRAGATPRLNVFSLNGRA